MTSGTSHRLTLALGAAAVVVLPLVPVATASGGAAGAVYALTNSSDGNAVLVYQRGGDGLLTPAGSFATGGTGTGASLGSQGAVIVSDDHQLLFAVNAGSNSISSFRIRPDGLELVNTVPSGGTMPTSVAFFRGLLYVLNAGSPNNVSGFAVDRDGSVAPIAGSARPLSADSAGPAQVGFSDDGKVVIVTEKAMNRIDTYTVGTGGLLTGPLVHSSAGPTPFGFAVDKRNTLLVSEAGTGGGASSYRIGADGSLEAVSSMGMTGQRAACWAGVTKNGRYCYVTKAGARNSSGFAIAQDGSASLLNADGVTAATGGNPQDMALSLDSSYLYARVPVTGVIAIFRIRSDGSLDPLPSLTATPSGLVG